MVPSRRQQKTNLKKKFFCLLLFEGTFTSFFTDKKSKRSHKTVGILSIWIRIQEAQQRMDPTDPDSDPDPQHCFILNPLLTEPTPLYFVDLGVEILGKCAIFWGVMRFITPFQGGT
jgi:hypothetical protein